MEHFPDDDFADLNDLDLRYIPLTPEQATRALREVASCEACTPDSPWLIPFDWLLRDVSEQKGDVDYVLPAPLSCPGCSQEINEKTLVEPNGGIETREAVLK